MSAFLFFRSRSNGQVMVTKGFNLIIMIPVEKWMGNITSYGQTS